MSQNKLFSQANRDQYSSIRLSLSLKWSTCLHVGVLWGIVLLAHPNVTWAQKSKDSNNPSNPSNPTKSNPSNPAKSKQQKQNKKKAKSKAAVKSSPKVQRTLDQIIESETGTKQKKAVWKDFKKHAALYIKRSQELQLTSHHFFKFFSAEQEESIENRYKSDITQLDSAESEQRQNSIQKFQEFLDEHKPHPQYTPDSLYRLAMLLLEEEDSQYLQRVEEFNQKLATASEDEDIIPPQKDHRKVISTLDRLIQNWPTYHDLDSAFYARAHCYLEMGEEERALKDFQVIAQSKRFKKSQYYIESWNLIGELHFKFAELQKAIHAYKQVIKDRESIYFMFAYYKLAWTYYRNDQFEDAVAYLKRLIQINDIREQKGDKGFELRKEAIDYLAISLNEEDWNDDGMIVEL